MSYKLVVCAALLSVVALAAPRGASFEEEALIQDSTEDSVSSLLSPRVENLKKQFNALQMQIQAGTKITPGVKKGIDKLIGMVEKEIEPTIKEAHNADQALVNELMDAIDEHNKWTTSTTARLLEQAAHHRKKIAEHNDQGEKWRLQGITYKNSIPVYEATYFNRSTVCCRRREVEVLAMEYTPAYYDCDFTKPDAAGCVQRADAAVQKYTEEPFRHGLARYIHWKTGCDNEKAQQKKDKKIMDDHDAKCDELQADTIERKEWLDADRIRFDKEWKHVTTYYVPQYKRLRRKYTSNEVKVWEREATRKKEWAATQEIKCMLQGYRAGGKFDKEHMKMCKKAITTYHLIIDYPKWVCRLNYKPVLPPFPAITDTTPWSQECQRFAKPDNSPIEKCSPPAPHPTPECENHINQHDFSGEMSQAEALAVHMREHNDHQIGNAIKLQKKHHHAEL